MRFMESPLDFCAVHWDLEPDFEAKLVWCPAFRRPGPAKAGTPNRRFMESPLGLVVHWEHEPTPSPSKEGRRTAWPGPLSAFAARHSAASARRRLGGVRGGFVAHGSWRAPFRFLRLHRDHEPV